MASTEPPETRHRIKVRILVVFASILAFLAIFTSWIDRQALDTEPVGRHQRQAAPGQGDLGRRRHLRRRPALRERRRLGGRQAATAERTSSSSRPPWPPGSAVRHAGGPAGDPVARASSRRWRDANRIAHTQLVSILKGNNEAVSSAERQGRPQPAAAGPPARRPDRAEEAAQRSAAAAGRRASSRSPTRKDLDTARTVTKLIEGLAWFFTFGSAGPVRASPPIWRQGRRWMVVLGYGLGLIAAGLARDRGAGRAEGALRRLAWRTPRRANVPAEHAWDIGTSLLQSIAITRGHLRRSSSSSPPSWPRRPRHAVGIRRALGADPARPARSSSGRSSARAALIGVDHLAARRVPASSFSPCC